MALKQTALKQGILKSWVQAVAATLKWGAVQALASVWEHGGGWMAEMMVPQRMAAIASQAAKPGALMKSKGAVERVL